MPRTKKPDPALDSEDQPADQAPYDPLNDVDPFDELTGDIDENIKVRLIRVSPNRWEGQDIAGFIDYLGPEDDYQTIKEKYGGGVYMLTKTKRGRVMTNRRVQISGSPRIPALEDIEPGPIEPKKSESAASSVGSGRPDNFRAKLDALIEARMIAALLPDPNIEMIGRLMEGKQPEDLTAQMARIAQMIEIVDQIKGGEPAGGGDGWAGAISQILGFMDKKLSMAQIQAAAKKPASNPAIASKVAPAMNENKTENLEKNGEEPMSLNELAARAVAICANMYLLDKKAAETVALLDQHLNLTKDDRKKLNTPAAKGYFENSCQVYLIEQGLEKAEINKFGKWFQAVWKSFVNPEREPIQLFEAKNE